MFVPVVAVCFAFGASAAFAQTAPPAPQNPAPGQGDGPEGEAKRTPGVNEPVPLNDAGTPAPNKAAETGLTDNKGQPKTLGTPNSSTTPSGN